MSKDNIPRGAPGRHPQALKPLPKGELKPGQVVFFPVCKKTPRAQPIMFRGHGFGIFVGVVPQGMKEPTRYMMDSLMSGIGWISFENIIELLGEEVFSDLAAKFKAKYETEPEESAEPDPEPQIELPPEKRLLGMDGKPI